MTAEQILQNQVDVYRETLGFTDDTVWSAVSPLIGKIVTLSSSIRTSMPGSTTGGGRGGPGAGGGGGRGGGGGGRGGTTVEVDPDITALQAAVDSNAPNDELKAKIAKVRAAMKTKHEAYVKAQEDFRKILSIRQEAIATINGLLQ